MRFYTCSKWQIASWEQAIVRPFAGTIHIERVIAIGPLRIALDQGPFRIGKR